MIALLAAVEAQALLAKMLQVHLESQEMVVLELHRQFLARL
jgi:hypothetical protein